MKFLRIFFPLTKSILFIPILIFIFLLVQCNCLNAQEKYTEQQFLLKNIFNELVEINTTATVGNTTNASQAMAKYLLEAEFPVEDINILSLNPIKGNLVARYRGAKKKKPLLLLAHIDVVEAKKKEWSFNPFKLTESEGFYYGRGTTDDKAMAAIFIANLIAYQKEGFKPERDIIVCLTSDEENAGTNGIQWLLKEHRNLIDAEFCINEGDTDK